MYSAIVDADESLTFYSDNTKTHAADVASDAAPRRQAPTPTQSEPFNHDLADGVAELSAVTRDDADGMTFSIRSFVRGFK